MLSKNTFHKTILKKKRKVKRNFPLLKKSNVIVSAFLLNRNKHLTAEPNIQKITHKNMLINYGIIISCKPYIYKSSPDKTQAKMTLSLDLPGN
jgi:hypothetical protein